MQVNKTRDLILCALFVVLIAVGAFIRVPVPVVPFTLQFLFTMLAGLLLGPRLGATAVLGYVAIGLLGLPIFAEGGGIGYIFKPSFGYLFGFAAGAYVTGVLAHQVPRPGLKRLFVANFLGLLVVYGLGMIYYYLITCLYLDDPIGLWPLFLYCFLLAVPGDIALCIVGAILGKRLIPILQRQAHDNRSA